MISGSLLFTGLLVASVGLYALDVYATARIDQLLLDYYGPQIYERYTNIYEPNIRWSTCVLVYFSWLLNHVTYLKLRRE